MHHIFAGISIRNSNNSVEDVVFKPNQDLRALVSESLEDLDGR